MTVENSNNFKKLLKLSKYKFSFIFLLFSSFVMMKNLRAFPSLLLISAILLIGNFACIVKTHEIENNFEFEFNNSSSYNNNNNNNNNNNYNNELNLINYEVKNLGNLAKRNFLVGIAEIGSKDNSTVECQENLATLLVAIQNREIWALKLIDAFGNVPNSFIWGNVYWFSNRDLCDDLNNPYRISLTPWIPRGTSPKVMTTRSPFPMEFRMIYYNFTSPMYIDLKLQYQHYIHVGLCFPASCTEEIVLNYSREYFQNRSFETQQNFEIDFKEVIETKVPGFQWKFLTNIGLILFLAILLTVLTFVLLAELLTRLHDQHSEKKVEISQGRSNLEKFILCFSIRENFAQMMQVDNSKGFLSCIAGLRTIVCLWVTLFHVYYYSLYAIKNVPFVFAKLESLTLQPVIQACFYVDVFFVISAFLLVYNFFSNTSCLLQIRENSFLQNAKLFFRFILYRYARLMPVFLIAILLSEAMFEFLHEWSPFLIDQYNGLYCRGSWWYNLFFLNNFLDLKYICLSWSWYLGCEMQFFIYFLLILFIYTKNEKAGKFVFFTSAIAFTIISFLCNYYHNYSFKMDIIYTTTEYVYVKPWARINPYFGGAFMGWLYYKTKSSGLNLKRTRLILFWSIFAIIYVTTNFISYWKNAPVWLVSGIMSVGKLIFGLVIGCAIFLCQHGYGGVFNSFMSAKLFRFLNKFCFSIYMLAPILVVAFFGLRTEATLFSEVASAVDFITIIVLSILASFISVLLLEIPFQRISNRFILKK